MPDPIIPDVTDLVLPEIVVNSEEEKKKKREEQKAILGEIIAAQEADAGTRSNLRDIVPTEPSDGIDEAPEYDTEPSLVDLTGGERTYENIVAERANRRRADLASRRANMDMVGPGEKSDQRSLLSAAVEPVRQGTRGFLGTAAGAPWDISAALTDLAGLFGEGRAAGPDSGDVADLLGPASDYMRARGQQARGVATAVTGASDENLNPLERLAGIAGESVTPGKGALLASGIVTGVRSAAEALFGNEAQAEEANAKKSYNELQKDCSTEWRASGKEGEWQKFLKDCTTKKGYQVRSTEAKARAAKGEKLPVVAPDITTEAAVNAGIQPRVSHTVVESVGGPTKVTNSELATIGGIAAVSIGMIFAPKLFSKFKFNRLPKLRPVTDAAPGTLDPSRLTDLARTYDDANAGALRILRDMGIDPRAVKEVETVMGLQTRSTAQALADSAVTQGRMETPAFTFQARVPLSQLVKLETPETTQYLHALDTIDDIKQASLARGAMRTGTVPEIREMTLADASLLKNNLEAAHPELIEIAKAYRDNLKAMRRFEASGEYATLSPAEFRFLNAQRPNTVPFGEARTTGFDVERGSAIESLGKEMQWRLRVRMENEAKGKFIDEMRKVEPGTFVPVTPAELTANPRWRKNVVTFERRGVTERYTTSPFLADVLRMDPYYMHSMIGQTMYSMKRLMEVGTTGELAPWFAATSMLRNYANGKLGAMYGMKSPTAVGTVMAIPQQIIPQMANSMSRMLDRNSAGWLGQVFGQGNLDALSTRLAAQYQSSFFHELQTVGGGRGSILQQQTTANNRLANAVSQIHGPWRDILEGYRSLLNSVHNASPYNFARRNRGGSMSLPELARETRGLTGDPRIGGQYYTKMQGSDRPVPIRYVNEESRVSHTLGKAVQLYGGATELGRTTVPWFNASIQGMKRYGEAYLHNPALFTGRLWLYQMMPSAASYMSARALGSDPNGLNYNDYMMNRRSGYNKLMNIYIPIPGRPAEEGIEFPRPHEQTLAGHMMEIGLDHAFRSSIFSESEDFMRAAAGFAGVVLEPPVPPLANVFAASMGMVGPQGVFAGEAYRKQSDPFDQTGGLPASIELYTRATSAGIADIIGAGYAAYTQTPEGFLNGLANAGSAAGKRIIAKTPLVRDIFNIRAPISGNNAVTEELFKKSRAMRQLENYYREWDKQGGMIGVKPRSASGETAAAQVLGERPPTESAGINQPPPTNPLYTMFMQEMHDRFARDAIVDKKGDPTGALGFQSLWNRYGIASRQLSRIRKVNDGNNVTWQKELEERPAQKEYLKRNNVDPSNIAQVRNFYEKQRQDAARVLLFTIRGVENDFSKRLGKTIKLEDLDPYKKVTMPGQDMTLTEPMQFGMP